MGLGLGFGFGLGFGYGYRVRCALARPPRGGKHARQSCGDVPRAHLVRVSVRVRVRDRVRVRVRVRCTHLAAAKVLAQRQGC